MYRLSLGPQKWLWWRSSTKYVTYYMSGFCLKYWEQVRLKNVSRDNMKKKKICILSQAPEIFSDSRVG